MDIQKKQAKWNQERPLFEAELVHSYWLQFFNFNNNTGDYELKESLQNDEDAKLAFEVVNTGWVMWLRAKAQKVAVPNKMEIEIKAHNLDCQIDELKSEIIEKNFISNELDDQLEDLIIKAIDLGELYAKRDFVAVPEGFVVVPKEMSDDLNDQLRDFMIDNFVRTNEDGDAFMECADFNLDMFYKAMIEAQEQVG